MFTRWGINFVHEGESAPTCFEYWTRKGAERMADHLTIMHRTRYGRGGEIQYRAVRL